MLSSCQPLHYACSLFAYVQHWEFTDTGYMSRRDMSANDYKIEEGERRYK